MKKVRICFGTYGNQELEKTIFNSFTKQSQKILGCTTICEDYPLCSECYWNWYLNFKKKGKRVRLFDFIDKFMNTNKLRFKRKNENFKRNFKKFKIQRK